VPHPEGVNRLAKIARRITIQAKLLRFRLRRLAARSAAPEAVLAYLSRYIHRVAIANSRLIAFDERGVTFKWKDYRIEGRDRYKRMTLATDEFIRRFLIHVLPKGGCPAFLLNIEKRSLPRLMLSGDGLASNGAV
jgi:hypothetical protein